MTKKQLFLGLALALFFWSYGPAEAQNNGVAIDTGDSGDSEYVVQLGDNLWHLAGAKLHNNALWEKVFDKNPFLREPGRRFEKQGVTYVRLHVGERLVGLEELGIVQSKIESLDSLIRERTIEVPIKQSESTGLPWWMWALPLAMGVGALVLMGQNILNRNAATARPPIVPGGVNAETAPTRFQIMASREHPSYGPAAFTIVSQEAGRIWGVLNVLYADGRQIPRNLSGDRAFQGIVRHPNGSEEVMYMLQACGNDLRTGGITRYLPGHDFRFEPDPQVVQPVAPSPAAAAQPEPAPVAVTTPQSSLKMVTTVEGKGEEVLFKFELKKAEGGKGAMIRVTGIDPNEGFEVIGTRQGMTVRFLPPTD